MRETNLGILLGSLHQGVQNPTLKNYRTTLETGLRILELASYDLPVLNDIFQYHHSFEDLCTKVSSYLCTNISLPTYRYSRHDNSLVECFDLDISKYDIRSLLILIRCHEISKGNTSRATRELFSNYTYIDENKKNKSLEEIKEALPNVSEKYITSRYKDPQNINKSYLYAQMVTANLYVLSYNHELFTYSSSNGRVFNAFTSLNKIFRNNELAFGLTEVDVISANCQFVDKIFKFDRWKSVYSNLMQAYEISRENAKIKYNATLNNHYLSVKDAEEVYLNSGYSPDEANQLAEATANNGKGGFYKLMANQEGLTMTAFIKSNFKNDRQIRLHDGIWYDASFETVENAVELGIQFSSSIIEKEKLTLNLKVDTFKVVLSTPSTSEFVVKQYYEKSKVRQVFSSESFSWFSGDFLQLSATFNISKPVIKNGKYRAPSEVEWLERVQKLYKISMYLNNGNDEHFRTCIEHLARHIQFSKNYIYAVLPTWKNLDINDGLNYLKNRDWVYHGGVSLTLSEFNSCYHAERRLFLNKQNRTKLKQDLIRLADAVENDRLYFIDKKKYLSAYTYEVGKLIDKVQGLIGVKKRDGVELFNKSVPIFQTLYLTDIYPQKDEYTQISKPFVSRRLKEKIGNFIKEKPTILLNLENAVSNIDDLQDISLLFTQPKQEEIMTHKYAPIQPISAQEAFSEPIDYTHSVYSNHTARTAILEGKEFYIAYSRFCRISELMRGKLFSNTKGYDAMRSEMDNQAKKLYDDHYESTLADSMSA
jgi:hypothetical protein